MSPIAKALEDWARWLDAEVRAPASVAPPPPTTDPAQQTIMRALGYLPSGSTPRDDEIAAAMRSLHDDAANAGWWQDDATAPPSADDDLFDRLAQALELRPNEFPGLPAPGELSLRSRLLQAQLALLGARQRPPGQPVDNDDDRDLINLATWLDPPGNLTAAALLHECDHGRREEALAPLARLAADADTLIERLLARDPSGFLVATRPSLVGMQLATGDVYTLPRDAAEQAGGFIDDGTFASLPPDTPRPLLTRAFQSSSSEMIMDNGNRLGLRLIQVKLKRRGLYAGAVDGVFGPGAWGALSEAARRMDPSDPAGGIMLTVRVLPSGVHVAVSLRLLSVQVLARSPPAGVQLRQLLAAQSDEEVAGVLSKALAAEQAPTPAPPPPPRSFSFFRSLLDLTHRVVEAIAEGLHRVAEFVADLASDLLTPLRDLLNWVRAVMRRLADLLLAGLEPFNHLLFAEPFGDAAAITRVSLDRDTITFLADPAGSRRQLDTMRHDNAVLDWSGRVLVVVVQVILAALVPPLGWVHLARLAIGAIADLLGPLAADA